MVQLCGQWVFESNAGRCYWFVSRSGAYVKLITGNDGYGEFDVNEDGSSMVTTATTMEFW